MNNLTTPKKTVENFSAVYKFFEQKEGNKSQCKFCLKILSGETTSNFRKHVLTKFKILFSLNQTNPICIYVKFNINSVYLFNLKYIIKFF